LKQSEYLKLDADDIPSYLDFVSCVISVFEGVSFFVHTTHSHTPDAPRYRVFILLSRDVSAEEYSLLAQIVKKKFPVSFDKHGRSVKQMMYLSTQN
jgi:putative DNA primase/helicase